MSLLFAGGIGVTPMIAMAHRLHALGKPFALHYSAASRRTAGFLDDLAQVPWKDKVHYHFKDEGARADLPALMPPYAAGMHVYTCGAPRYMDGVFEAAAARGWPEEAMHREYFSVPEADAWVNHAFTLRLAQDRHARSRCRPTAAPPTCWRRPASRSTPSAATACAASVRRRTTPAPRARSSTATSCSGARSASTRSSCAARGPRRRAATLVVDL